jgi:hypothetical protein
MAGERIEAFDPSGQLVTIPAEQAQDAQIQGYELATPESKMARQLEAEHGNQGGRTFLEGVGRGLTFGASDIVQAQGAGVGTRLGNWLADQTIGTGGADEEQLALDRAATEARAVDEAKAGLLGRQAANAGAAHSGELMGALGLGIATGGLGTAGLAGKGASVLGRAAYSALAGGIEGAAFGAAKAANDDYLNDREITAERIMLGARDGALLGGAFGAGGSLLGSGVKAAAQKIGGLIGGAGKAGQYLDDLAGESAYKAATGRTSKQSIKLADRQGGAAEVGRTLLDEGIDLTGDAESILAQTTAKADEVGAALGSVAKQADAFGTGGPSKAGLKEAIESKVMAPLRDGTFSETTANTVQAKLQKLFDILSPSEVVARGKDGAKRAINRDALSFEELRNLRRELDGELANWNSVAAEKGPLEAYRDVRRVMEDYWLDSAEEAAKKAGKEGFAAEVRDLKRRYAHLALARDQAQEAVQTQLANRATSLTDTLAGVGGGATVGGPMGFLAGIASSQAHRFVRERGRGYLATAIHRARQAATRGEQVMDDAAGGLIASTRSGIRAVGEATREAVPIGAVMLSPRDPRSYEQTIDHLIKLQDRNSPERLALTERHADLALEDSDAAKAMDDHTQRTVDFLVEKAGPSGIDYTSPFAHLSGPKHSREKAVELARYASAAQNPGAAFERIAAGKHTRHDVETLKALYPRQWARFGAKVRARLTELKEPPDYRTQVELSRLLDQPVSPFEQPGFQEAISGMDAASPTSPTEPTPSNVKTAQLASAQADTTTGSDQILARGQ